MKKQVEKSTFFKNKTIHIVNYGIDQNIFKPKNKKNARKKLNIDQNALVLAFRCTNYEFKGLDYIKYVLQKIHTKQKVILLMMEGNFTDFTPKYKHIEYGWINDDQQLADIYNATDIFLMPSLAEAFGMMAIESMSCGTLPIVLKGTSLPEIVNAPYCGVATEIDKECYCRTVQYFIDHQMKEKNGHLNASHLQENIIQKKCIGTIL
jgi:glycosyltransferase involved in cell wall biosynthesis